MRTLAAATPFLLASLACSGHQISSWSPSGSLDWDEPSGESDEESDAHDDDGASDAGTPAPRPWPDGTGGTADPAVVLTRADQRYAAGDLAAALSGYGQVFATGTREQQLHALHRMAWCEQHAGRIADGAERLLQLLALTDPPRDDDERRRRREAVQDLVTFEALRADATPAEVIDRLERALPEPERREALERLLTQYEAGGRAAEAEAVRARLSADAP
ncbi:MAG: hypothetical protein JXB32_14130 [Deltaproteobacteria bacterium]|nr:hypothetical protein [Deltaproteobacteria bacterium]